MAWADLPFARNHWADAGALDDGTLDDLLDVAREQVSAYAPPLTVPDQVPVSYRLAQVYQAREIAEAGKRDSQDVIGVGDYAIRARPLTATVKQLLRPQAGVKVIG